MFALTAIALIVVTLAIARSTIRASPFYVGWLSRHPAFGALMALQLALVFGLIAKDLGLSNLYWHTSSKVQFVSGIAVMSLSLFVVFLSDYASPDAVDDGRRAVIQAKRFEKWAGRRTVTRWMCSTARLTVQLFRHPALPRTWAGRLGFYLWRMNLPLALALTIVPIASALRSPDDASPASDSAEYWRDFALPAGSLATLILSTAFVWALGKASKSEKFVKFTLFFLVCCTLAIPFGWGLQEQLRWMMTGSLCLSLLLALASLVIFLAYRRGIVLLGFILVPIGIQAWTNSDDFKLRYPGLERWYEAPLDLSYAEAGVGREPEMLAGGGSLQDIQQYAGILEMYPRDRRGVVGRAAAKAGSGRLSEAEKDLDSEINRFLSKDPSTYATRALIRGARGNFGLALADFDVAAKADPSRAVIKFGRGNALLAQTRYSEAIEALEAAVEANREDVVTRINLGIAYSAINEATLAQIHLDRAISGLDARIEQDPGDHLSMIHRGLAREVSRDYDGAIRDYDRAAKLAPDPTNAWLAWAKALLFKGDHDAALASLDEHFAKDTTNLTVRIMRGSLYLRAKDLRRATAEFDESMKLDPTSIANLQNHSNILEARGDQEGSMADLKKAAEIDPAAIQPRIGLARLLQQRGRPAEAITAATAAKDLAPDSIAARTTRAMIYQENRRFGEAKDDLDHVARLYPKLAAVLIQRGLLRILLGDPAGAEADLDRAVILDQTPTALVERSVYRQSHGKFKEAVEDCDAAIRSWPGDVKLRLHRSNVRAAQGMLAEARADLDEASRLAPRDPMVLMSRAMLLASEGAPEKAMEALDEALSISPGDPLILNNRSILSAKKGDYERALLDLGEVLKSRPDDVVGRINRSSIYDKQGKTQEALEDLGVALRKEPDNILALQNRAYLFRAGGDPEKALADLDRLIEVDGANVPARITRAGINSLKGDLAKSGSDLDEALKIDPNHALALTARASLRLQRGDLPGALADSKKAADLHPDDAFVRLVRSSCLGASGDLAAALDELDKAVGLEPGSAWARFERGRLGLSMNRTGPALEDLEKAAQLDPKLEVAWRALADVHASRNDLPRAISAIEKAIELSPEDGLLQAALSGYLATSGKFARALAASEKAVSLSPRVPQVYLSRASLRARDGRDMAGALSDIRKAIELDGDDPAPLALRWSISQGDGQPRTLDGDDLHKAAELMWRIASRKTPGPTNPALNRPDVWLQLPTPSPAAQANLRGIEAARHDRFDEARASFTHALELDPSSRLPILFNRAVAESRSDRRLPAVSDFLEALKYDPRISQIFSKPPMQPILHTVRRDVLAPTRFVPARPDVLTYRNPPISLPGGRFNATKPDPLLADRKVLEAWKKKIGGERPKLVVVATSGGGIVAAYWTVLCLSEIERQYPSLRFPYHIRAIAGASGGMLGAGYYVAELVEPAKRPTGADLAKLQMRMLSKISADGLTPTIQQLVVRDLPSIFDPRVQENDRGRELEAAWEFNTGGVLGQSFQSFRGGEAAGWRPSLMLSPTIAEQGRRLLISNLDLGDPITGTLTGGVQFFRLFPEAEEFRLSTAIRMNAAFPYVLPAVILPAKRPRLRVIDAGYLENYGVELLDAWLTRNQEWLAQNTGGIALVEIRAYPPGLRAELAEVSESRPRPLDFLSRLAHGMEWALTPLDGYTTAKRAAMLDANKARVQRLIREFNIAAGRNSEDRRDFLRQFVFQCTEDAPLGLSLTPSDRRRLDFALKRSDVNRAELDRLADFMAKD